MGIGFALAHPRAARSTPTRSSLAGAVLAVTGVVAALVFGASLERLVDEPARWGWHGDIVVVDATPEIVDGILADDRVAALSVIESTTVPIGGRQVNAYALTDRRSSAGWTVVRGRAPDADDEVLVGTRVADRTGVDVGDRLAVDSGETLRVVGVGLGPVLVGEDLGDSVQLTPGGLVANGRTAAFTEAMVRAGPGARGPLVADLVERYEVTVSAPPAAVADLGDLDRLPHVLGGFLALVGVAALADSLSGTVRRRAPDLAVLRVLGFTPARTGRALVAMALTTTVVGLAVGVPLGLGVGRLSWWLVADANAVATDAAVPVVALAAVAVGALGGGAARRRAPRPPRRRRRARDPPAGRLTRSSCRRSGAVPRPGGSEGLGGEVLLAQVGDGAGVERPLGQIGGLVGRHQDHGEARVLANRACGTWRSRPCPGSLMSRSTRSVGEAREGRAPPRRCRPRPRP